MNEETAVAWLKKRLQEQIPEQMPIIDFWLYIAKKKEKEQMVGFGEKMQIVKDVSFDGDVEFMFNPLQKFEETYGHN